MPPARDHRPTTTRRTTCMTDFNYNHLLPHKPPVTPITLPMSKVCPDCGVTYVTLARINKRCSECQVKADARAQARANEKLRAKRRAAGAGTGRRRRRAAIQDDPDFAWETPGEDGMAGE
jgi:hypothetical protein